MSPLQIGSRLLTLYLLASLVVADIIPSVWQPYDVVTYFCQRWYHQSVVKNRTLYIHGGIQTFNTPNHEPDWTNNTLGYNQFLLQVDLKTSWDWQGNLSTIALEEAPNPKTGTSVRHSIRGTMYQGPSNDSMVYTYGGTQFRGNESFPNKDANYYSAKYLDQYSLWSFDNNTQIWDQYDIKQSWTPSYGAAAEAPDQGLAFYLNGRMDNGTSSSTLYDGDVQTTLDGIIVIDMVQHTSRNASTEGIKNYQPRVGGGMQYVPGVGENGVLVAFSGQVFDGKKVTTSQDKGRLLGLDTVDVFDIASYLENPSKNGTWYSQATSGEIPPPRLDFCTIIVSAPDNSSHNIYLYGGQDPTASNGTIYYDDIYVLSLPSFTWILYFSGKTPRWGHTCHHVGQRQMLTVGGHDQNPNSCDWEKKSVAILDLPSIRWGSIYHANDDPYVLSDNIIAKIGGTPKGNATLKTPEKGWASEKLGQIISTNRIYSNDPVNNTVTPDPGSSGFDSKTKVATIVGTSIAGVVLIACICFLTWMYRRHRNISRFSSRGSSPLVEIDDKPRFELSPDGKRLYEAVGTECRYELPNNALLAEADRGNAVTYAVELPTTNFQDEGRWGVPIIRVPTPALLGRSNIRSSSVDSDPETPNKKTTVVKWV
ncbi:uncharacterized protein BDR25DRAFT_383545 [Lindgomyces ingoldianus]|uniref:Uncharacterized protein n=1 Tax=Lindgomyces ingoldianus TaxID=673940 RepID=A0ACB6Q9V6_9PLEO|nr:uncharacterized protein BDR25DRAFT_383545 [Lindgomyces ingoldianus]KAF2463665.1 hypothetical protein BDR25DRAFT_383545 [Lindgomyces ingoldianus]